MIKIQEKPMFYFKIYTSKEGKTEWLFRDSYIKVDFVNQSKSKHFQYIQNQSGFMILKSIDKNIENIYKNLLNMDFSEPKIPLLDGSFLLIFFDSHRKILVVSKDRIGLHSCIYRKYPFTLESFGLDGSEIEPGIVIFTEDAKIVHSYDKFILKRKEDIELEVAMQLMEDALLKAIIPDVPILFSGGLDSTLLAALSAVKGSKIIHLINFCGDISAPDKESSERSYEDLKKSFPNTEFILHQHIAKLDDFRSIAHIVEQKIKPQDRTEMNLNIAMVLMCASSLTDGDMLMTGLGADELFCGYMKMKDAETSDQQVAMHIERLWERNGGRDDRVFCHNGKISHCPFLATDVLDIALSVPKSMLIKSDLPRGIGEKWLLRKISEKYSLSNASKRPKQAMQFGTKVAKVPWRD